MLLNIRQLSAELNVSVPTIYRIEGLPRVKVGARAVRFDLNEVREFLSHK